MPTTNDIKFGNNWFCNYILGSQFNGHTAYLANNASVNKYVSRIFSTHYAGLPHFVTKFAACTGGIWVSFIDTCLFWFVIKLPAWDIHPIQLFRWFLRKCFSGIYSLCYPGISMTIHCCFNFKLLLIRLYISQTPPPPPPPTHTHQKQTKTNKPKKTPTPPPKKKKTTKKTTKKQTNPTTNKQTIQNK